MATSGPEPTFPVNVAFGFLRFWRSVEQCMNGPRFTVAQCGIFWPNGAMDGKRWGITQQARIDTTRTCAQ